MGIRLEIAAQHLSRRAAFAFVCAVDVLAAQLDIAIGQQMQPFIGMHVKLPVGQAALCAFQRTFTRFAVVSECIALCPHGGALIFCHPCEHNLPLGGSSGDAVETQPGELAHEPFFFFGLCFCRFKHDSQ